jgi:hypothetical protein
MSSNCLACPVKFYQKQSGDITLVQSVHYCFGIFCSIGGAISTFNMPSGIFFLSSPFSRHTSSPTTTETMLFWLAFFLAALAMVKASPTPTIGLLSCSTIFPTFWHLLNPSDSSLPNSVNRLFSDGSSPSGVMTLKQSNDSTKP